MFWNPISYYIIYDNAPLFPTNENQIFYWLYSIVFLISILSIYLIQKNKCNERIKNYIFLIAFIGILFAVFVMIDSLIGLTLSTEKIHEQKQEGIIFQPNRKSTQWDYEFKNDVKINSIGLRDRELNIEKDNKYRILCFGDSWTFGWGVNIENSWPKQLEGYLHKIGYNNVEVINCGQGGQYTTT